MNEGLNTLSAADVAAVTRNNDGNMWGDGGWFWIIILAFLFCGNGWGNNNGAQDAFISDEFVKRDIFNTNQNVSNTACIAVEPVISCLSAVVMPSGLAYKHLVACTMYMAYMDSYSYLL